MAETTLERLHKEVVSLRKLITAQTTTQKQTWVGIGAITELTGWSGKEKIRWARRNGIIKYDSSKGYLLESLPQHFILPQYKTQNHEQHH